MNHSRISYRATPVTSGPLAGSFKPWIAVYEGKRKAWQETGQTAYLYRHDANAAAKQWATEIADGAKGLNIFLFNAQ